MLAVNEEFFSIQGEGENTGIPMYFVRLQGCSVGCHFCDTKKSWHESEADEKESEIVKRALQSGARWICITGGEPCEQDLRELILQIKATKLKSQIETSGSEFNTSLHDFTHVVVSPKDLFTQEKFKCNELALDCADELKCVVTKESDINYYLDHYGDFKRRKSFQPVSNDKGVMCLIMEKLKEIEGWKVRCQQQTVFQIR